MTHQTHSKHKTHMTDVQLVFFKANRCGSAARPTANFNLLAGLTAAFAGCEARSAEQPADVHPQRLSRERSDLDNAQNEERAVCVCLNPFDVIAVELARYLFFGALPILGDVPEVRGDIK